MPPWRQADHNGRDERIMYLSRDVMREAIHTPVCLPPTVEGGDGYALQVARDQTDQMSGARLQLADGTFKIVVHPRTAPRILATAALRNASSRNASCSNSRITSSGTLGSRSARPICIQWSSESLSCARKRAAIWIALMSATGCGLPHGSVTRQVVAA